MSSPPENGIPGPLIQIDLDQRMVSGLRTILSEVGTEWVGYATGRRELVSLGKLGAPKVITRAGQAGPVPLGDPPRWRAIVRSSSRRGRRGLLWYRAKIPRKWLHVKESGLTSPHLPPNLGVCKGPITIGFAVWLTLPIWVLISQSSRWTWRLTPLKRA